MNFIELAARCKALADEHAKDCGLVHDGRPCEDFSALRSAQHAAETLRDLPQVVWELIEAKVTQ